MPHGELLRLLFRGYWLQYSTAFLIFKRKQLYALYVDTLGLFVLVSEESHLPIDGWSKVGNLLGSEEFLSMNRVDFACQGQSTNGDN